MASQSWPPYSHQLARIVVQVQKSLIFHRVSCSLVTVTFIISYSPPVVLYSAQILLPLNAITLSHQIQPLRCLETFSVTEPLLQLTRHHCTPQRNPLWSRRSEYHDFHNPPFHIPIIASTKICQLYTFIFAILLLLVLIIKIPLRSSRGRHGQTVKSFSFFLLHFYFLFPSSPWSWAPPLEFTKHHIFHIIAHIFSKTKKGR